MRIYTQRVETKTCKNLEKIKCDICGVEYESEKFYDAPEDDYVDEYDTTVSFVKSYKYDDGSLLEAEDYDICPSCFTKEIIPLMKYHINE